MLSLTQGQELVRLSRKAIEAYFNKRKIERKELEKFKEKRGIFVTLHTYPGMQLRGCIGLPYPVMSLGDAIVEAACSSAFKDPRFLSLKEPELSRIIIEISVLTEPKKIECKPEELPKNIEVGKDGLICNYKNFSGLLLPQVAIEKKWDSKEFLKRTCVKTGVPGDAWLDPGCKFYKFQAQIFSEKKPKGEIGEK